MLPRKFKDFAIQDFVDSAQGERFTVYTVLNQLIGYGDLRGSAIIQYINITKFRTVWFFIAVICFYLVQLSLILNYLLEVLK